MKYIYWQYLFTFVQSNLLEVVIYYWFYRNKYSFKIILILVTLANLITHPWVFFGFMSSRWGYLFSILVAEAFAVVCEMFLHSLFGKIPLKLTFKAAFWANLFSWQLAPILTFGISFL